MFIVFVCEIEFQVVDSGIAICDVSLYQTTYFFQLPAVAVAYRCVLIASFVHNHYFEPIELPIYCYGIYSV